MLDDPRSTGEARKGAKLDKFWKNRLGEGRIISSSIEDGALRILVGKDGNRREVNRQRARLVRKQWMWRP